MSICGTKAPETISELMAYMMSIICVNREYTGLALMHDNILFCKHAVLKGDTRWSAINLTLYTRCFTGVTKEAVKHKLCMYMTHEASEFPHKRNEITMETCLLNIEEAVQSFAQCPSQHHGIWSSREVCRKLNSQGCSYLYCRHVHVCSTCGRPHPETQCHRSTRRVGTTINRPG